MTDKKPWTGERLETFIHNENTNEHLHRYALALDLVKGKNVLDIACGEGYGSFLLAGAAATVAGVDIDKDTISNAAEKYKSGNLTFQTGSAADIPYPDAQFDVVVSFETLEHHNQHYKMMLEAKRVLAPGGLLIISSPDKLFYTDKPDYHNPYHVKELYAAEFKALLEDHFKNCFFMKQKSFYGSVLIPQEDVTPNDELVRYEGDYANIVQSGFDAVYIIGIASDLPLPGFKISFFDGQPVLKQQFADFQNLVTETVKADVTRDIEASRTFKIGSVMIKPFKLVKKLLNARS